MERRVNTLMAGAYKARSARGRYSMAGYVAEAERPMYIARVPAGSAQDNLRDLNRVGYRSERPWHDTPTPAFEGGEAAVAMPSVPAHRRKRQMTLTERLMLSVKREKKDFIACVVVLALILLMGAAGGQKLVAGVEIQRKTEEYQEMTRQLNLDIEGIEVQLELARNGERIRNLAQNELNMLRPERANTETIYIQTSESTQQENLQQYEEPRLELLDVLLGLLNVFHIGE